MQRTLVVARMDGRDADAVAGIFAESDDGELPGLVGVRHRELFRFHGLYFQLIEADDPVPGRLAGLRGHPLFTDISSKLAHYVQPYDPATWREPKDAMATSFYQWDAS